MSTIPLAIPNVGEGEARNLAKCIADNFVSTVGPFVTEFENRVAETSNTPFGVAVGSGTQALHMALLAVGVEPNDLVIVPSFTFIASANAVRHAGAWPWFADIRKEDWTLCPEAVETLLRDETEVVDGTRRHKKTGQRVMAMIPVFTLGNIPDMTRLSALAKTYGLRVVSDAAAALGADGEGKGPAVGADLACFSFNGNKIITSGGGGMIVGHDPDMIRRARHLSTTARTTPQYDFDEVGYNYRMTNLQAAVGCAQMDRLGDFLATKARIRHQYDAAFANHALVEIFPEGEFGSTYWFSGLVFRDGLADHVDLLANHLKGLGIEARSFWKPVHDQKPHRDAMHGPLPVTDALWHRIITLPCSTSLSEADQDRVIAGVRAYLDQVMTAGVAAKALT